jgi:hypothetical protein
MGDDFELEFDSGTAPRGQGGRAQPVAPGDPPVARVAGDDGAVPDA